MQTAYGEIAGIEEFVEDDAYVYATKEGIVFEYLTYMLDLLHDHVKSCVSTVEFDNAKQRAGAFHPRKRKITLSRIYVEHATWEAIENTIKHEFAHALDFANTGTSNHGVAWQLECERLGMKEITRCWSEEEAPDMPKGKYEGHCPNCDKIVAYRWRLAEKDRGSYLHRTCRSRLEWNEVVKS
jgi:predicted SprT family Zn-dependent metalloprotease